MRVLICCDGLRRRRLGTSRVLQVSLVLAFVVDIVVVAGAAVGTILVCYCWYICDFVVVNRVHIIFEARCFDIYTK